LLKLTHLNKGHLLIIHWQKQTKLCFNFDMILNKIKDMNKSLIPCVKWLHRSGTIDSDNIRSSFHNFWISSQTFCYATNVSMPTVVVTPAKATSDFTLFRINLHHFPWHAQPVWTTASCLIPSCTNTITIIPPAITDNALAHYDDKSFWLKW